jgi:archaellum biogenesis protein FlaJ (TadC family)
MSGGHSPMSKPVTFLIVVIVVLSILVSAGPTLIALAHAAVPLVIVGGIVAVVLRLVFFHTRH